MTLYELGKNTKKTEYKVPGEVKKLFENYLKAQKVIDKDTWENVSAELVIVSWLNAFGESEEYKSVMEAAKEKKQNAEKEADEAKKKRKAEAQAKKDKAEAERIEKARRRLWELEHPEEAAAQKKAAKEAKKNAE